MCKPHYGNQNLSPLANGVYFTVIIKKIPLKDVNSSVTNPITKMGVVYDFKAYLPIHSFLHFIVLLSHKVYQRQITHASYTVTRKFPVSSNGCMERLKCNFYSFGYYCTPNLSIHQNSTQELTWPLI